MHPIVFIFLMIACSAFGQNFSNSDLEGPVGMSSTPQGWFNISYADINCQAYNNIAATPDVTGLQGPVPAIGVSGQPFSGNSFVSGLISGIPGAHHHEGIRQTVTGLIPGKPYTITFHQTVVKQNNQLDSSGGWSVYMDDVLIGSTLPSTSTLNFDDQNLNWEERKISFNAAQATHQFKFLPADDDNDQTVPFESLRMGIDQITLHADSSLIHHDTICLGETATVWAEGADQYHWVPLNDPNNVLSYDSTLHISPDSTTHYLCINNLDSTIATVTVLHPPVVNLGPDHYICAGDSTLIHAEVHHANAHYWHNGSIAPELSTREEGMYWLLAENSCGTASDSVSVHLDHIANLDFGFDTSVCAHEGIQLEVFHPNASYSWSNGSTDNAQWISSSGDYSVTMSNTCGSSTHEFNIDFHHCEGALEMPNVFSPNEDGLNDYFVPVHEIHVLAYQCLVLNRWGQVVFETSDIQLGWNGDIRGEPANEGVYFWKVVYSTPQADNIEEHGSLTLVR